MQVWVLLIFLFITLKPFSETQPWLSENHFCLAFLKSSVLALQMLFFLKLLPNISQSIQKQCVDCWTSFLRVWLGSIHFWKSTLDLRIAWSFIHHVIAYATLLLLKLWWRSDYWRVWDDCFTGWTTDRTNWLHRIFTMAEQKDPRCGFMCTNETPFSIV